MTDENLTTLAKLLVNALKHGMATDQEAIDLSLDAFRMILPAPRDRKKATPAPKKAKASASGETVESPRG